MKPITALRFGYFESNLQYKVNSMAAKTGPAFLTSPKGQNMSFFDLEHTFDAAILGKMEIERKEINTTLAEPNPLNIQMLPTHLRAMKLLERNLHGLEPKSQGKKTWIATLDEIIGKPTQPSTLTHILKILSDSPIINLDIIPSDQQFRLLQKAAERFPELKASLKSTLQVEDEGTNENNISMYA